MTLRSLASTLAAHPLRAMFLVTVLAICLYIPGTTGAFFSDDYVYVIGNEHMKMPLADSWKFFTTQTNRYEYLPIRDLSYRIDWAFFGENPLGYKLVNLLLYGLACFAAWLATRAVLRFFARQRGEDAHSARIELLALAATALFAFHPAHVEAVVWISGRKDLLAGGFALASIWMFTRAIMEGDTHRGRLTAACVLLALALFSKMTVMPMGAVAVVLAFSRYGVRDGGWKRAFAVSLPMIAISAFAFTVGVIVGMNSSVVPKHAVSGAALLSTGIWLRALTLFGSFTRITVLPLFPRIIYTEGAPGLPLISSVVLGSIALLAAGRGAVLLARRRSLAGFGALAFFLFCLPFLQIMQFVTWSFVSDRFLFLAVWAAALAVVPLLPRLRPVMRVAVLSAVCLVFAVVSFRQSAVWSDTDLLQKQPADYSPESLETVLMYADIVLLRDGKYGEARKRAAGLTSPFDRELMLRYVNGREAERHGDLARAAVEASWIETAMGLQAPAPMLAFIGSQYARQGATFEACRCYMAAIPVLFNNDEQRRAERELARIRMPFRRRLDTLRAAAAAQPDDIFSMGVLANQCLELAMYAEADSCFRSILSRNPGNPVAHFNRALALEGQGRDKDAITGYRAAIGGGMREAFVHNNLGLLLARQGESEEAKAEFANALRADPSYWFAPFNLGLMHAMREEKAEAKAAFGVARRILVETGGDPSIIDLYLKTLETD